MNTATKLLIFGQTVTHEHQGDKRYMVLKYSDNNPNSLDVLTEEGELATLHLSHVNMKDEKPTISAASVVNLIVASKNLQNNMQAFFGHAAEFYMRNDIKKLTESLMGLITQPVKVQPKVVQEEITQPKRHGIQR